MSTLLEESAKKRIGRLLAKTVSRYFKEEENRREFEKWYFEKYGVNYQWKSGGVDRRDDYSQKTV